MTKVKAKPYVAIFLKALKDASKENEKVKGFFYGMMRQVPLEQAIIKLNENEDAIKCMVEHIVKEYNIKKADGKI